MSVIRISPDTPHLAQAAAEYVVEVAQSAIAGQKRFSIALSGGSTPRDLYRLLASSAFAKRLEWDNVHIFWGDERCVPPDHPDSNYSMAKETLLNPVKLPPTNVHRMKGEAQPAFAAVEYERVLKRFFGEQEPNFDLVLLGMGDDGHTASLFPGTAAVHESKRWVVENYVAPKNMWRITLTPVAINAAAHVAFLIAGSGKARRLKQTLGGAYTPDELPAQLIRPRQGELMWFLDAAAAALL
jgi:6-phosphogluconolactonase